MGFQTTAAAAVAAWHAGAVPKRCVSNTGGSGREGTGNGAAPPPDDGLLAGGVWAELRSWARFLLPTRYRAVYYPTPLPIVDAMLQLARVGPGDTVYDIGCGDGRIVVAAAQQMGAERCIGIELDPRLAALARHAVSTSGLPPGRVEIVQGDAAGADLSDATVVTLYLSASGNRELLRSVAGLRPGTRVVSLYFAVEGWESQLEQHDKSKNVDIYLYRAP